MSEPAAPLLGAPPLPRYGLTELVKGANPAAGAHFVNELGGAFFVRLITVSCRLVTDANAADRTVVLEYRDDGDVRFAMTGGVLTQTATLTRDWYFNAFQPAAVAGVDDSFLVPLAPILLYPTWDFRVFVDNVQAGDQLSRVRFLWERFYTD